MNADVVIIGAGHNGLVAAAMLARAGRQVLVLEAAQHVGGCAITSEVAPGFRVPTLAHRAAIDPSIVRALELERWGLSIIRPEALVCAPTVDGRALTLWENADMAAVEIARFSGRDAARYTTFVKTMAAMGAVVESLMGEPAPELQHPRISDWMALFNHARDVRGLGKSDAYQLLRWLPMPVADFLSEWFESEPLSATLAADGVFGSFLGPRSPGSAAVRLLLAARDGHPVAPGWSVRGGPGALSEALAAAARQAGADIRMGAPGGPGGPGGNVQRILVENNTVRGVTLANGERIQATVVVSSLDPRRTFLTLVEPDVLPATFVKMIQDVRMRGTLAKVNYAVSSMPRPLGLERMNEVGVRAALSGCLRLCPTIESLERAFDAAKYGAYSADPWIELAIPSIADPSLAPADQHVVSAYVQFAPYALRGTTWDEERERFGDLVTRTISAYIPDFDGSIVAREVITPLDLERKYGLTGGQIFHGELALDQLFVARPVYGWARHRTPVHNLFLCGSGTHPGTGLDGRSGALAARAILAAKV